MHQEPRKAHELKNLQNREESNSRPSSSLVGLRDASQIFLSAFAVVLTSTISTFATSTLPVSLES